MVGQRGAHGLGGGIGVVAYLMVMKHTIYYSVGAHT